MRLIRPNWPAPLNVIAFTTTRHGGVSTGQYDSLNIAGHVGDSQASVCANRSTLAGELPSQTSIQWLTQEHTSTVVTAQSGHEQPCADGSFSRTPAVACAVMTADCLPVLFCNRASHDKSDVVAVAHAGWRGMKDGILESCISAMDTDPARLIAWMGPAIGPAAFEVGEDVRAQFLLSSSPADEAQVDLCFSKKNNKPGFYLADLYALARIRLASAGVSQVYGGGWCTYSDTEQFFSYRRDGSTGRMATVIALKPHLN